MKHWPRTQGGSKKRLACQATSASAYAQTPLKCSSAGKSNTPSHHPIRHCGGPVMNTTSLLTTVSALVIAQSQICFPLRTNQASWFYRHIWGWMLLMLCSSLWLIQISTAHDYPREITSSSSFRDSHSTSFKRIPLQSNTTSMTHPAAVQKEYDHHAAQCLRTKVHEDACLKMTDCEIEIARITVRMHPFMSLRVHTYRS